MKQVITILDFNKSLICICDMRGIFRNIFRCVHLLMHAHRVTDAWHQEAHMVAYVITT